jgi:hypothetical protein
MNNRHIIISAEKLISGDAEIRAAGIREIIEMRTYLDSPLIIYLLATRINDPDHGIRIYVTNILAEVLQKSKEEDPERIVESKVTLINYLMNLDESEIRALLEIGVQDLSMRQKVTRILKNCSCADVTLVLLLKDNHESIEMRMLAADLLGEIGFVKQLVPLENYQSRLQKRLKQNNGDETDKRFKLSRAVGSAISKLNQKH